MYRVSPLTYFVSTLASAGLAGVGVTCAAAEFVRLDPPEGQTCGLYLREYIATSGGTLQNADATEDCGFCPVAQVDDILATLGIHFETRWRDLGISLTYTVANILGALAVHWAAAALKRSKAKRLRKS